MCVNCQCAQPSGGYQINVDGHQGNNADIDNFLVDAGDHRTNAEYHQAHVNGHQFKTHGHQVLVRFWSAVVLVDFLSETTRDAERVQAEPAPNVNAKHIARLMDLKG